MAAGEDRHGRRLRSVGWEPYTGPRSPRRLPRLLAESVALLWRAAPGATAIVFALQLVASVAAAITLLVISRVIETAVRDAGQGVDLGVLLPQLGLLAAVLAAGATAQLAQASLRALLIERVTWYAFERLLDVAAVAELTAFESPDFHDRLTRAQNAGGRPLAITQSLVGIGGSLTTMASLLTVLLALEPLLTLPLVVMVVPLVAASMAFSRQFYRFTVEFNESERRRYYLRSLLVTREGAKEVRTYGLAAHLRQRNRDLFAERLAALRGVVRRSVPQAVLGGLGAALAIAGSVGMLMALVLAGRASVGAATAGALAVLQLAGVLTVLSVSVGQLYESSLFLDDYRSFCALLPEVAEPSDGPAPPDGFDEIRVDDVRFCYPGSQTPALDGVSLRLARGEVVALVGENGSGKTTLAKLLCRLYPPTSGRIWWDATDLADLDAARVRDRIAVVFQDFGRYLFTVAENIGMGRVARMDDRAAVARAATVAGADEFIAGLPDGYDSVLGKVFEGGVDLSTGQWQRIALARAFFRDASMVILDEPTAALDPRAEHELFDRTRQLFAGRTVLLISHRFSTVRSADRIYVMDKGHIVESGDHAELMRGGGLYAELYNLQAEAYADGAERVGS
jgi:ATP-binding cassette, subfamily B, bacterial